MSKDFEAQVGYQVPNRKMRRRTGGGTSCIERQDAKESLLGRTYAYTPSVTSRWDSRLRNATECEKLVDACIIAAERRNWPATTRIMPVWLLSLSPINILTINPYQAVRRMDTTWM
jgi:hypothetical protein